MGSLVVKESAGSDVGVGGVMGVISPTSFLYAMDDVQCSTKHDHIGIVIHQTEEEESKNIPPFCEPRWSSYGCFMTFISTVTNIDVI